MEQLINDLINGNNGDAKRRARRFKAWDIRAACVDLGGMSWEKATLAADWLKGRDCWQQYCDAN